MFKVIHITNKEVALVNAITVLCKDNMNFSIAKLEPAKIRELIEGQHVTIDLQLAMLKPELQVLVKDQFCRDTNIFDIYDDEWERTSESDMDYNFDDVILFVDLDYVEDGFTLTYYKIDILI